MFLSKQIKQLALASLCALGAAGAQAAIVNGGFEAGPASGAPAGWTDTDTSYGYNRCSLADCNNAQVGASSGNYWIWFGGSGDAQTGVLTQSAVVEAGTTLLNFDFMAYATSGASSLRLTIDGNTLWSVDDSGADAYSSAYFVIGIPVAAYADGASHVISWQFNDAAGDGASWFLDNARLVSTDATVPEPGSLALVGLAGLALAAVRRRAAR